MIGTEAGKGGYHVYRILPKNPSDDEALKQGKQGAKAGQVAQVKAAPPSAVLR
jgi:hypothetical protein